MIRLEDVLKTSWRCLEDVLKTSWRRLGKTSWRRHQDVFWRRRRKTSSRRLQYVCIKTNVCWVAAFVTVVVFNTYVFVKKSFFTKFISKIPAKHNAPRLKQFWANNLALSWCFAFLTYSETQNVFVVTLPW